MTGYALVTLEIFRSVPDEFRKLAERIGDHHL